MNFKLELNGGKLSKRDQDLLILLSLLLIVGLTLTFFVLPVSRSIRADRAEIEAQEENQLLSRQKMELLERQRETNRENKQVVAELEEPFYPWMESDQIGALLTDMALKGGLMAVDMNIAMPVFPAAVEGYRYNGYNGGETADGTAVVYTAVVNMKVSGAEKKLQAMLDRLCNDEEAIRVNSFTWNYGNALKDAGLVPQHELEMELELYMYRD